VLVRAEAFELRPEAGVTNVNVSVFRGRVRVDDPRGGLRCDVLTLRTRGEENRPESALAEGSVGLGQGEYQVRCARAYYLAEAGTVAMQGDTRWRMAGREGRSDQLQLGLADRVYRAMGHVSMRLASDALGAAPWLVPQAGSTSGPLEVQCDEFEFRTAAAPAPDVAVYRGGVRVLHPGGMTLDCEELRAEMAGGTNGVERVVAERHVEIRMSQEGGERWARGDQAIYRAGAGELELTGAEGIEFKVVDAKGAVQGRGRRALYSRARDRLELDGRPVLRTSHGDAVGDVVRLDRSHAVLSAAGQWRLRLPVRAADLPSVPAWPE
jgi:lipopolysaccharide export system protein LptA